MWFDRWFDRGGLFDQLCCRSRTECVRLILVVVFSSVLADGKADDLLDLGRRESLINRECIVDF